jgi:hypothetical protein
VRLWLIVIPVTYVVLLCALAWPAVHMAFEADFLTLGWAGAVAESFDRAYEEELYRSPWFHLILLIMVAAQVGLLLPAGRPAARPRARRSLTLALVATSLLAGLLCVGLLLALTCGIWGDDWLEALDPMFTTLEWLPDILAVPIFFLFPLLAGWGIWWFILLKATKNRPSPGFARRACHWLITGSVLELLVALPCHVASRNREDCCAPFGTFFGIATGTSIALLCCGPALLYLVRDRLQLKKPRASASSRK